MADLLYPHFLTDLAEYDRAEALWRQHWDDLVRRVRPGEDWKSPWLSTTFADGTPFHDANPIFSAVCFPRHLGIRVIQVEPSEDSRELDFWIDTFAEGVPQAVRELVISCTLTQQTLREALDLMRQWIEQGKIQQGPDGIAPAKPEGRSPARPDQEPVGG
jgi:hypothetical protein